MHIDFPTLLKIAGKKWLDGVHVKADRFLAMFSDFLYTNSMGFPIFLRKLTF